MLLYALTRDEQFVGVDVCGGCGGGHMKRDICTYYAHVCCSLANDSALCRIWRVDHFSTRYAFIFGIEYDWSLLRIKKYVEMDAYCLGVAPLKWQSNSVAIEMKPHTDLSAIDNGMIEKRVCYKTKSVPRRLPYNTQARAVQHPFDSFSISRVALTICSTMIIARGVVKCRRSVTAHFIYPNDWVATSSPLCWCWHATNNARARELFKSDKLITRSVRLIPFFLSLNTAAVIYTHTQKRTDCPP